MNTKATQESWNDMRMHVMDWWDRLTEEDLDFINGDQEELVNVLRDKYGYTRSFAESEVERHMTHFDSEREDEGFSPSSDHSNNDLGQSSPQSGNVSNMSERNSPDEKSQLNQNQKMRGGQRSKSTQSNKSSRSSKSDKKNRAPKSKS